MAMMLASYGKLGTRVNTTCTVDNEGRLTPFASFTDDGTGNGTYAVDTVTVTTAGAFGLSRR